MINTGTEGSAAQSEYGGHFSAIAAHIRTTPAVGVRSSSTTLTPTSSPSSTTSTLGLPGRELANNTPSTTTPLTDHQDQMMPGTGALFADGEAPPGPGRGSDGDSPSLGQWDKSPPGLGHGENHHPRFDMGSGLLPPNPVTQAPSVQPAPRQPRPYSGQSTKTEAPACYEQTQISDQKQRDILKGHEYFEDHGHHLVLQCSNSNSRDEYDTCSGIPSTYTGEMASASALSAQDNIQSYQSLQGQLPQQHWNTTLEHGLRQSRPSSFCLRNSCDHSSPCRSSQASTPCQSSGHSPAYQSTYTPSNESLTPRSSLSRPMPSYGLSGSNQSRSGGSAPGSSSAGIGIQQDRRVSLQVDPTLSLTNTLNTPNLGGRFEFSAALPIKPQYHHEPVYTFAVSTDDKPESDLLTPTVSIQREFLEASLRQPLHHDSCHGSSDHQHDAFLNYTSSAPACASSACFNAEDEESSVSILPDENHRAPSGRVANTEAVRLDHNGSTRVGGLMASAMHRNGEFNVCNSLARGN